LFFLAVFVNSQLSSHWWCSVFVTAIFAHAQVSTFAINYRGHPFMESLTENRALLYSLAGAGGFVVMLALGKLAFQKPNSWTYNFFEVSGHNLQSSPDLRFLYGFLRGCGKGDVVFCQVFLRCLLQCTVAHWRNCKRLREFE
jgi:hypothetical protein